jgi:2-polyprenyl-3-methyl-5-hydroxy-6-metoxy-1,4-benzoquinol methylase
MNMHSSASESKDDYFNNHQLGDRWPFTIYHRPIEHSLAQHVNLAASIAAPRNAAVLVFGCGLFHEARLFPQNTTITLVDCDPRLLAPLNSRLPSGLVKEIIITDSYEELDHRLEAGFDLIIAKEVIEHIVEAPRYLSLFYKKLRTQGMLWLSTPNYGDWPLPIIENTFLELVARTRGFSRKDIHPNKYAEEKLRNELLAAGFEDMCIDKTPYLLALTAMGLKRQGTDG